MTATAGAGWAAEPATAVTAVGAVDAAAPPTTVKSWALEWTTTELGPPANADGRVDAAAAGENVVVMSPAGQRLSAWVGAGDGWTRADVGREAAGDWVHVQAMGAVPGGVLAVVNYHEAPAPELWFSADGSSWEQLKAEGFDGPAWAGAVGATDAAVFVMGARRTEESSSVPMVWRSEDLVAWTRTDLLARGDVVAAGSSLLVAGPGGGGALMWRSYDEGRSWATAPVQEVDGEGLVLYDMAAGNGVVVAVGSSDEDVQGFVILSSTDDGGSWIRPELDADMAAGLEHDGAVRWAGGAFWIIASRGFDIWDDYDRCYADLASCQAYSEAVVLRSADGVEWAEIDMGAVNPPEYFRVWDVVDAGDGVALVGSAYRVFVSFWPSRAAPPLRAPPGVLEAPAYELAWNVAELEVGATYRHPLYIHCGMDYLASLNGRHWYLVDAPQGTVETGAGEMPRSSWPVAQQTILGFVTLVDEDTIEYTIGDSDVIGVYEPSDTDPPGCD